ncbi:MAG: hypothetical protein GEU80_01740 [Dehalococcoidia bacterium]|nr:hypothetical protein [Dehalococcoidia bacterium]
MSPSPPGPALPRPAVLGAIIVVGTWALAIFWVAFTPPGAGAASDEAVELLSAAVERLHGHVEALDVQVAALEGDRDRLAAALDTSGGRDATPFAGAEPPPAPTAEATVTATSEPTPQPTAEPTRTATPEPTPVATSTPAVPSTVTPLVAASEGDPDNPWYSDGQDLWSCHNFASFEEAQEAYRANLPGDPNLIDGDQNGVACEARRY